MEIPGKVDVFSDAPMKSFQKTEFINIPTKKPEAPNTTSGTIPANRQLMLLTPHSNVPNVPATSTTDPRVAKEREAIQVVEKAIEIDDLLVKMVAATSGGHTNEVASTMRSIIRALQTVASINGFPPTTNSALNYACMNIEPPHDSSYVNAQSE